MNPVVVLTFVVLLAIVLIEMFTNSDDSDGGDSGQL
jgi:hypothetical protein